MTIWIYLSIATGILSLVFLICGIADNWYNEIWGCLLIAQVCVFATVLIIAIIQPFAMRQDGIRYKKEREQILFQIDHLTPETDKIKLNEWILSYNDWVNDINSGKETWGIFDWYYGFDMSGHEIIQLV